MELFALVLLGGLVALDGTSVGQVMISRPLVAATLAGWLLGEPALGLLIGSLLELFYIVVIPAGGALFPEGGPAAVIAATSATVLPGPGGVALAVLLGLAWGQIGGVSIVLLRQVNGRLAPATIRGPVSEARIARMHRLGILLDFGRGCTLTFGGLVLAFALGKAIGSLLGGEHGLDAWPLGWSDTIGLLIFGAAAPLGMLLRNFVRGKGSFLLFAAGLVGGVVALVIL